MIGIVIGTSDYDDNDHDDDDADVRLFDGGVAIDHHTSE